MHIVWSFRSLTMIISSRDLTNRPPRKLPGYPWNKSYISRGPMNFEQDLLERSLYWRHKYHCHILWYMRIPPICSFYRTSNSHIHVYLRWRWNKLLIFKRNLVRGLGVHLARGPVTWFRLQRCEWYMNISSRFSKVFNRFCHTSTCVLYHHLRWSIPSAHDGKWCTICSWPPQAQFWRFCQSRCRGQKGPIPKKGTSRVQDKWNGWGDRVHPWGSW